MDFAPEPELEAFRREVRQWIKENLPADLAKRGWRDYHIKRADSSRWIRILNEKGWAGPHFPVEHGGTGWEPVKAFIFHEELRLAGAPKLDQSASELVAPVIWAYGTEDQKAYFLPRILNGEDFWGQGFSEPNSGSDLVSLRTRADHDPATDEYVVNGTKIWTTEGHQADWIFMLVRTDQEAKPQRGISFLLIDMKSPGIEVKPIYTIDEAHSVNQVFFDDVRVPAKNLVGELNMGWTYAKFLLVNERTMSAEVPHTKRDLVQVERIARQVLRKGRPVIEDPLFRARLAKLKADLLALEWAVRRVLYADHGDAALDSVAAVLKLRGAELRQRAAELAAEALGDHGVAVVQDPDEEDYVKRDGLAPDIIEEGYGIQNKCMYRRTTTIYGGSNEIQRNIIAKAVLGL